MPESRKDLERKHRRELLLEAAERVFGRKPFDEASMQDVAAEAQIGMQGLYEHFPSKQSLYESLILERVQGFQRRVTSALNGAADPMERLTLWARHKVETVRGAPAFYPVFLAEKVHHDWGFSSRFGPTTYEVYGREQKRLCRIMGDAVKAGRLRREEPEFLAKFFLGSLEASLHYHLKHRPDEEVETCVERAMTFFLAGAGAAP
jgi:TetR/AcrR family transcriptional regulator